MKHARLDYERFQDPLGLIPEDEPVFLVRGQDVNGPDTLRFWATVAADRGADVLITSRVVDHAIAMQAWQATNAVKTPDMPAPNPGVPAGATHRHVKTGGFYRLIAFGRIQASSWFAAKTVTDALLGDGPSMDTAPSVDMTDVAIYFSLQDFTFWVRPREEFEDGRFERVAP